MTRTIHVKPLAPKRPPTAWQRLKNAFQRTVFHAALQLADGHAWNALAVVALAALSAIPPEILHAHNWLRLALPVALAAVGVAARGAWHAQGKS